MELTVGRFLRLLVAIIVLAAIGWLLYSLGTIISIMIISALIAYILDPVASYLEAKGMSRTNSTVIIFLSFFVLLGLIGWIFMPGLFHELFTLQQNLNFGDTSSIAETVKDFIKINLPFLNAESMNIEQKTQDMVALLTNEIFALLANLLSVVSYVVIIPFIVFFLLKDGRNMKKAFIHFIPNRYFEMTLNVLHKIDQQLGWYLRGQFTEALVVGVLSVIALWLLDVQYFTIIGIFAGLANLIPYIGPVAGAVPAILVTVLNGGEPTLILYIVIAFAVVQLIDNVLLQPLVLSKSVNLHPLIIVFAVLIGGQFFGILGMVLAVPVAGIIKVTSSEFYQGIRKFNLI